MKIAIILPGLALGGAERVAVSLSNWIAKNKKEDEIYFINMGEDTGNFEFDSKVKVYHKNYNTKDIKGFKPIVLLKKFNLKSNYVYSTLEKIKPDVIFEMLYVPLIFLRKYKRKNKNVVIIGSERANPEVKNMPWIKRKFAKLCPKFCNGYIFQTERVREMFKNSIKDKSTVIPNAVSNPYLAELKNVERKKIISNMGRLEYQKGQDILIKAFYEVQKKYPEYNLVIYGEGSKERELRELIKKLNLEDKVIIPGKTPKAILEINKSEIFVFPSRYEGMPNALLEAMACGLPCIAADCIAGPSEIIKEGVNGFLVEVDNVEQIAERIIYLIENKDIANKMGQEAKKVLEDYSIDTIFNKYYEYFKKVQNETIRRR